MIDFKTDIDGDLVIERGDLVTVDESTAVVQEIIFRMKSDRFDYQPLPEAGAGLDRFRGQPNTAETGRRIEQAAIRALTFDGKFTRDAFTVQAVPIGPHLIALYVFAVPRLTGIVTPVRVSFDIDLNLGLITAITGGTR